jgi:hypothetical protein
LILGSCSDQVNRYSVEAMQPMTRFTLVLAEIWVPWSAWVVPVSRIGASGLVADNFMSARGCQLVWKWKSVELELVRWILVDT